MSDRDFKLAKQFAERAAAAQAEIDAVGYGDPKDREITRLRTELDKAEISIGQLERSHAWHIADIEALRAEVKRRGEMLRRTNPYVAEQAHFSRSLDVQASARELLEQIEALTDE